VTASRRVDGRWASVALLVGGLTVIVGASLAGSDGLLDAIVSPPAIVRAALVGGMVVVAILLGRASLERFTSAGATSGPLAAADPLPLVIAAVIAAVDVVETSFLLLVVGPFRARGHADEG
jgi:hypothetical protein